MCYRGWVSLQGGIGGRSGREQLASVDKEGSAMAFRCGGLYQSPYPAPPYPVPHPSLYSCGVARARSPCTRSARSSHPATRAASARTSRASACAASTPPSCATLPLQTPRSTGRSRLHQMPCTMATPRCGASGKVLYSRRWAEMPQPDNRW